VWDQITIAASYEAKRLGIRVGTPFWEAERMIKKDLVKKHPDHAFYREISERLMGYLSTRLGKLEIFSIDETFATVSGMANEYEKFAHDLKVSIYHDIGIPVSIGISNTRIRAKMFGDLHKPYGTTVVWDTDEVENIWKKLPVREVPFIGRGSADRLGVHIRTVYDFYSMDPRSIQKLLGKNGVILWCELHGVDTWQPRDVEKKRKSIVVSRSFNQEMNTNPHFLWRQALIHFERAYETLLAEGQWARIIGIFLRKKDFTYTSKYSDLGETTIDRKHMIEALRTLFLACYSAEFIYRTVGVTFAELSPFSPRQLSVFDVREERIEHNSRLHATLEWLRARYGASIIHEGYVAKHKKEGLGVLFEVG
jgi:nucleotidyltransferase/DNA polymerase involved in DNA repair